MFMNFLIYVVSTLFHTILGHSTKITSYWVFSWYFSQDEFCLAPVQEPGSVWVEIAYSRTSHECLSHVQNRFPFSETSGVKETNCGGTFIFVGDVISMAHSIQLTSYQPRWGPQIVAYFPNLLERILIWTFHVSLALALLNGLPVSDVFLLMLGITKHINVDIVHK